MGAQAVDRLPTAAIALLGIGSALALSVVAGAGPSVVAPLAILATLLAVAHRTLLSWHALLAGIVLVILFVSIKRYELPANLPFNLELYRLLVAFVILAWVLSLLVDPRVRIHRSAFDAPLLVLVGAILASELANPGNVQSLSTYVWKSLTFALSFLLVYYFAVSVLIRRRHVDLVLGLLVAGGAILALGAIYERRTGDNLFFRLSDLLPFLEFKGGDELGRSSGRLRVFGTAQHPIALGALFAMLMPIGFALGHRSKRGWWFLATAALGLGVMATASRTPIVMLVAAAIVFLLLKPKETKRLWPIAIPAVVIVHVALPGAIGTIRQAFFPPGGLVSEQSELPENADPLLAGGRLRLLGPSIDEWSYKPLFGQGYGTRITGFTEPDRNAPILDNQWLATLLELGAVGIVAWVWLFVRAVRRLVRASEDAPDDEAWLYVGLAAAITAFAVGMFTYDAFSFIQVTFVFWIVLGIAAAALRLQPKTSDTAESLPKPLRESP